ncbi:ATP-binding protein [Spirillospora sp. CA-255316]
MVAGAVAFGAVVQRDVLASRASVGVARRFVAGTLRGWGLERYEEAAVAIVSELATNAVEVSAPDDTVRVHLSRRGGELWLGVLDGAGGVRPVLREVVGSVEELDASAAEDFGGWGLRLARHYADRFWVEAAQEPGCKWVCAAIAVG